MQTGIPMYMFQGYNRYPGNGNGLEIANCGTTLISKVGSLEFYM